MKYYEIENHFTKFKNHLLGREEKVLTNEASAEATERREQFAALPPEHKESLISPQLEIYTSSVSRKSEVLPVMATLAATLIIVATLNKEVVPLGTTETKVILSIFLILIPFTLFYYIKLMEETARRAIKIIRSYQQENLFAKLDKITFIQQLSSDTPSIIAYIFFLIILLIIFRIWFG